MEEPASDETPEAVPPRDAANRPDGDDLVFLMGKFEAKIPRDRLYARNHMWARPRDGRLRFGFAAYAVRLLQDVYFLEWTIDPGTRVREKEAIGNIESSKAESELYSPAAGTVTDFNATLLSDPTPINTDKYGTGWLFELEPAGTPLLLSPEDYLTHLAAAWEIAQRTIKKQVH